MAESAEQDGRPEVGRLLIKLSPNSFHHCKLPSSSTQMLHTTVISAPGKVLIAGGYLVLDPAYSGVVVSTSSRFYTALRDEPSLKPNTIRVRSPQFIDATWLYSAELEPSVLIEPLGEKCVVPISYHSGSHILTSAYQFQQK